MSNATVQPLLVLIQPRHWLNGCLTETSKGHIVTLGNLHAPPVYTGEHKYAGGDNASMRIPEIA